MSGNNESYISSALTIAELQPEIQLLLLLSRTSMEESQVELAREIISAPIDWTRFCALADFHRVFPLVHLNLRRHRFEGVAEAAAESLAERCRSNQQRIMELTGELLQLSNRFEAAGVEMIPLKGPALAATVYGSLALRPAGDLDILVREKDAPAALDVLRSCGYSVVLSSSGMRANDAQEVAIQRFLYHFILIDEARDLSVELHFNLAPKKMPFLASPEELFRSSESCRIGGRSISLLNDYENLLYLCVHGGKHAWSRLEWIVGVAELLRKMGSCDEARLWSLAERRGAATSLLLGVFLAKTLFDAGEMRDLFSQAGQSPLVRELSATVLKRLEILEPDQAVQGWFQWKLSQAWREKLRWWIATTFHPAKDDIRFVTCRLPWLYYFVRPVRSARSRVSRLVRGGQRFFARRRATG